jgi:hypothetical protein
MGVRLSALCSSCAVPQKYLLVLISVRVWANPRAMEGLDKLKRFIHLTWTWNCGIACVTVSLSSVLPCAPTSLWHKVMANHSPVHTACPVADWDTCIQHGSWHLFDCPEGCVRRICSDGTLLNLSQQQVGLCGNMISGVVSWQVCVGGLYKNKKINTICSGLFHKVCDGAFFLLTFVNLVMVNWFGVLIP